MRELAKKILIKGKTNTYYVLIAKTSILDIKFKDLLEELENIINVLNKIVTFPLVLLIRGYQLIVSPMLGSNCRFMPTCSEYALESLKAYGLIKGTYLTIKRIEKVSPLGKQWI